jgi:antitoxin ParD1/3/4
MTPDMLEAIRNGAASGVYASTSEVLRDAPRLWRHQRAEDAERLEVIRARIRRSLDDPRPSLSEDEVDTRLDRLFEETSTAMPDAAI